MAVGLGFVSTGCGGSSTHKTAAARAAATANVDATLHAAQQAQHAGRLAEAKREYEHVLDEDEANDDALYGLGLIAQRRGDTKTAERYWLLALIANGNFRPAVSSLAALASRRNNLDEAQWLYGQLAHLDPNDAEAHFQLGLVYLRDGHPATGGLELLKAVKLDPALRARIPKSVRLPRVKTTPTTRPTATTRTH